MYDRPVYILYAWGGVGWGLCCLCCRARGRPGSQGHRKAFVHHPLHGMKWHWLLAQMSGRREGLGNKENERETQKKRMQRETWRNRQMDREGHRQGDTVERKKDGQERTERNAGKVWGFCKSMIGLKRKKNRGTKKTVGWKRGSWASVPCKQVASVADSSSDLPQWDTSSAFLPQI